MKFKRETEAQNTEPAPIATEPTRETQVEGVSRVLLEAIVVAGLLSHKADVKPEWAVQKARTFVDALAK